MTPSASEPAPWWLCPNKPPCPHAALFHDIEDYEDPFPRCCFDGCPCGQKDDAGRLPAMRYRVENIDIPEHGGSAPPVTETLELNGRRIIHVIDVQPGSNSSVHTRVLTEEAPAPAVEYDFRSPERTQPL